MLRVALVDLGMGNLHSVERALAQGAANAGVALTVDRSGDPAVVRRADKIVVPGQGAFRDCAAALGQGMGDALRERIAAGVPFLGICLGLQALFEGSEEAPGAAGLAVLAGRVVRLTAGEGYKIPHMGWNRVTVVRPVAVPLQGIEGEHFYFVHSYHAVPADPGIVAAVTEHGPHRVTAAIQRENVTATQFHPEKSQAAGLRLLEAFLSG
jgi:imidazole glycerol-phosphate synthase subunit HisH